MEENVPSAQAEAVNTQPVQQDAGEGIQQRINELTAKFRQAEEAARQKDSQLMEMSAKYADLAVQMQRQQMQATAPAQPAYADPLEKYKDALDPTAAEAIRAAVEATQRKMEAQFQTVLQRQAAEQAVYAVRAEVAAIPNLPREVAQRAEQLLTSWRASGVNYPPQDAINFAMGEYATGQLKKAAPVMGYNPATQQPAVTPGINPAPAPQRALPPNFEQLSPRQQLDYMEKMGIGDMPF